MKREKKQLLMEQIPYSAAMTREQFLFYEMRTTAKLKCEGLSDEQIIERIVEDNLFQYPTEKSVKRMANGCLTRLEILNDTQLVEMIAGQSSDVAKQVCLYAMMKQYRLVWDFMITVIGEKYRLMDTSFSKMEMNVFFMRLQEQDDKVASWSDSTISKLKQVLLKMLVENDYLDSTKAERLNPVLLNSALENAIRAAGHEAALPAFNCFN